MKHYHMRFGTDLGWFKNESPENAFAHDNIWSLFRNGRKSYKKLYIFEFAAGYPLVAVLDVDHRFMELAYRLYNRYTPFCSPENKLTLPDTLRDPVHAPKNDWYSYMIFWVLDDISNKLKDHWCDAQKYIESEILEMARLS